VAGPSNFVRLDPSGSPPTSSGCTTGEGRASGERHTHRTDRARREVAHWYKDAVFYECHVRAFRDSDGDGIGDFRGLIEKLDYIQELGITAIWLLPFYPSPLRDDGYDISDYRQVHPPTGHCATSGSSCAKRTAAG